MVSSTARRSPGRSPGTMTDGLHTTFQPPPTPPGAAAGGPRGPGPPPGPGPPGGPPPPPFFPRPASAPPAPPPPPRPPRRPGLGWPGSPWPIHSARPAAEPACRRVRRGYACGPRAGTPLPSPPQGTIDLPGSVPACQVMTLVVGPLAAGQSQLDLGLPVFEVQRQRDKSQAALGGRRSQLVNLPAVPKQLTGSARLMVVPRALGVRR